MKRYSGITLFVLVAGLLAGCAAPEAPVPALVGSDAPDFMLDDALGGQTSLSDYEGKPVLLFFHMAVG